MWTPDTLKITNKDGSTYFYVNDVKSPLTDFDVTRQRRADTSRERSQKHGVNPTVSLKGGMEIHIEGALFDDSSTLYLAQRQSFVAAVEGNPNIDPVLSDRFDLYLDFTPDGGTEVWRATCIVSEFTNPVRANFPSLSEWALTLFSWMPWCVGLSTSTKYYF